MAEWGNPEGEAKLIEAAQYLIEQRMTQLDRPPTIDPNHEYAHKVGATQLTAFRRGEIKLIASSCGKVWAPTQFDMAAKKRCPDCFPSVPSRFAIAS